MTYILISEVPPGWTISERQNAHRAMKEEGIQASTYPNLKTHSRGNEADTNDEDGNPSGAATAWIVQGEFTEAELERSFWVDVIATELDVNPVAVDAKVQYTIFLDADECRQFIADNAAAWGE